jgi:pimeloyl-ACP methyl ester carboxylesterase
MGRLTIADIELHYEEAGSGEAIVFSHGLLFDTRMFESQIEAFRDRYRCIAYDHRGQGRSAVPDDRSISIDTLTEDAAALIEGLGAGPCHFVGLSMGGFVGMRLAARRPDLVRSLILLSTSADEESAENLRGYRLLNVVAQTLGPAVVAGRVMPIMFGPEYLQDATRADDRRRWRRVIGGNRRSISKAVRGVLERESCSAELGRIQAPTLIVAAESDAATPPEKSERIHRALPDSQLVRIPHCGHMSTVERPEVVNQTIARFLASL